MIKCVGVNFLAGFHRLPSSFMSALCLLQTSSGWARGVPSLRLESVTLAITALRRGDGSFIERLICFYFASPFHVPSSSIMQTKQLLLAWPKISFRFVCKRVWKTQTNFLANPVHWNERQLSIFLRLCSVMFDFSVTLWTIACRLLCPWDSPGKNSGVCCHAFLPGSSPPRDWACVSTAVKCLLRCRQILYLLSHWGSPFLHL